MSRLKKYSIRWGLISFLLFQLHEIKAQQNLLLRDETGKQFQILQNNSISAQNGLLTVRGRILTDDYDPAPAATVSGPNGSMSSDSDGKFTYMINPDSIDNQFELCIEYPGYVRLKIILSRALFPEEDNFTLFTDNIILHSPPEIEETVCTVRNVSIQAERPKSLADKIIKNIYYPWN
jgi:hypothetical protein